MIKIEDFWRYMCDRLFGESLREAVLFWGPMKGEARSIAILLAQSAAVNVTPGQWVHICVDQDIYYYFDEATTNTELPQANAAFHTPSGVDSGKLLAGHYDRIVPPGCNTLVCTTVTAATGSINVQRQSSGRRKVW